MSTSTIALAVLLSLSPVDGHHASIPGFEESPQARAARYVIDADDISAVVDERCAGRGRSCIRSGLAFLTGIAVEESDLRPDVDAGQCYRLDLRLGNCDGGNAHAVFQIWESPRSNPERAARLDHDRRFAANVALSLANWSWAKCAAAGFPIEERFAAYAAGGAWRSDSARKSSRAIWRYVSKALGVIDHELAKEPPPAS